MIKSFKNLKKRAIRRSGKLSDTIAESGSNKQKHWDRAQWWIEIMLQHNEGIHPPLELQGEILQINNPLNSPSKYSVMLTNRSISANIETSLHSRMMSPINCLETLQTIDYFSSKPDCITFISSVCVVFQLSVYCV